MVYAMVMYDMVMVWYGKCRNVVSYCIVWIVSENSSSFRYFQSLTVDRISCFKATKDLTKDCVSLVDDNASSKDGMVWKVLYLL